MECRIVKDMLSEYIDNELNQDQTGTVDTHLRDCESCRKEFEELLAVHGLFADAERFTAPLGFSTRVIANLPERKTSVWGTLFARPVFLRTIEAAFALVILIVGLISGNMLIAQKPFSVSSAGIQRSFALDVFEAAPSGSLGGVYVAMMGAEHER
jgi:anti-sigma factor RsiW